MLMIQIVYQMMFQINAFQNYVQDLVEMESFKLMVNNLMMVTIYPVMDVINVNTNVILNVIKDKVVKSVIINLPQLMKQLQVKRKQQDEEANLDIVISRYSDNQIFIDLQCLSQFGNGILNLKYEQCNDGNQFGGDEYSSVCSEEDFYQRQNYENASSICSYILHIDLILINLLNKTNQTQLIQLSFTQNVKLLQGFKFEEIAVFSIIYETIASINVKQISNLSTAYNIPLYEITVEFFEPVENSVLQIESAQSIIKNQFDLDLLRNQSCHFFCII
ncbi:unnamed protein product [Paramecium sonneborni]|uniref:Uncharacterized protein n=1 Tax=Paramecium sonneborni TaxID=65129 RepID=A0A8S1RQY2_9CILI|nr:unnamed protein product [Paramecium sonneborni]